MDRQAFIECKMRKIDFYVEYTVHLLIALTVSFQPSRGHDHSILSIAVCLPIHIDDELNSSVLALPNFATLMSAGLKLFFKPLNIHSQPADFLIQRCF